MRFIDRHTVMQSTRHFLLLLELSVFLIYVVSALKCGVSFVSEGGRVVGGRVAIPGEMPWLVALFKEKLDGSYKHFCGASILSEEWLITAAHCIEDLKLQYIKGAAAELNISMTNSKREIFFDKMIVHENYTTGELDEPINDIALLHTKSPLELSKSNNMNSICLPESKQEFNKMMHIAGWGKVHEYGEPSKVLKVAQIFRVNDSDCRIAYRRAFHIEQMLCAGDSVRRIDSCEGDSGGPLVKKVNDTFVLAGLVSFGKGCARKRHTGVYTRVSNYVDWIYENTKISQTKNIVNEIKESPEKKFAFKIRNRNAKYSRNRDFRFNRRGFKKVKKIRKYYRTRKY